MGYKKRSDEVLYLIREFEQVPYMKKRIVQLQQELEQMENTIYGLPKKKVDIPPDRINSPLPMPTFRGSSGTSFPYDLIDKKDELVKEIQVLIERVSKAYHYLNMLEETQKRIIERLYFDKESATILADEYGYSYKAFMSYVNSTKSNIIQ